MKNHLFQKPLFWAITIFLTASVFRLFFLDLIEFKYDEAFTVFQMVQFYSHPYLMQTGPIQSTGVYNPPLYNYLMIFISLFSRNPQYLSFIIALINSLSITAFYFVIGKYLGKSTAVFSSLLFALSPWSIIFSRKIWIPDLIFPFMVVFIYFLLKLLVERSAKTTLPLFVMLALLIQLHASGLFFAVTTVLVLALTRIKVNWKEALVGFTIGLIPALPYFIRQFSSTPFCADCIAFLNYQAAAKHFDLNVFIRPFQLIGGLNFESLLGHDYRTFLESSPLLKIINSLYMAIILIPLGGAVYIIKSGRQHLFLILYLALLPLLYLITRTPSYMHYFVILIPFMALLYGLSFKFIWESRKNYLGKTLAISLFLGLSSLNIFFIGTFYNFVSAKQIIDGDYGQIYPKTREFVEQQTADYRFLQDYDLIKSYAYMFAASPMFHAKLGEAFAQGNNTPLAIAEFKKALEANPKDTFSRSNLVYIYILTKDFSSASEQLKILSVQDSTASAKLMELMQRAKKL